MLKLILSTDWIAGRNAVLDLVAQDVRQRKGNRILMVPELISHDMERRLCDAAGDTASRYAQVLSFTRLARRVSELVGSASQECLDNGGRVVAMAAAARQLHSRLKAYAEMETRPEFLTGLVDAVDEFKRCCITSVDLMKASGNTDGAFSEKLKELALLLESYDALCAQGKQDPRDQMTWVLQQLYDCNFAQEHTFYIDGFPDFTRQHMAILEYLIHVSPNVTVSLNCDKVDSTNVAFEKAGHTASQLIRFAKDRSIPYQIVSIKPDQSALEIMRCGLFQGQISYYPELAKKLLVCRAESIQAECRGAAKRVMELVRKGCRYRRIGIVCTDIDAYTNVMKLVFNRCGIPIYQSGTEDILSKTVVNTVLSAMDAALGGFETQDVLRYLKSALSPLDQETCDLLENYTFLWGINGGRWLRNWENHPDGLGETWTEEAHSRLEALNAARIAAITPLADLQRRFRDASRLSQQVEGLCSFFEDIALAQRLGQLSDAMDAAGDNRSAQILNQLWEILLTALEQLYAVLGDTKWETEYFTRLLTLLLSQYDVGTIPPVLDAVTVGPVSAMRCQEMDHLILLGAQEGSLPGYCGTAGILTDQERETLRQLGVPLTGGGVEGLQAEFSEIYGVFCGARESVMVSCSGSQPSFVYRRLAQMSGGEMPMEDFVYGSDVLDTAAFLVSCNDADSARNLGILSEYQRIKDRSSYQLGTVSGDNIRKLYGRKLRLSASQVDKQAECRLAYFLRYGLRAKERKEASVDPAEFGTYVHAVLEHTAAEVMQRGGFHQVSLDETMSIAMDYSDQYTQERFSQLDSQRLTYLFQRNVRELAMVVEELWRELSCSEFTPIDFELAFGDGEKMDAIQITGAAMPAQLRGFVDRVDAWSNGYTNYFRVVDYKTGKKDFDYCDVFNGIGLQMLLYLFALEQGGSDLLGEHTASAGVQYFPARSPLVSANGRLEPKEAEAERSKNWKRRGLLLADMDVIQAMEPEGSAKRLSCKVSKDGTLSGDVATREQLTQLKGYLFRVLRRLVDEIASGNVQPNPYTRGNAHSACTWCPYQAVCHSESVEGRRNYKAMTAQRFWEEIGKEMSHSG